MDDDDRPLSRQPRFTPIGLDGLSVADLQAYIEQLRAEIARAEGAIAARDQHRSKADQFFKTP